jgi:TPR repeat protein
MLRIITLSIMLGPLLAWSGFATADSLAEAEQLLQAGEQAAAFEQFERLAIGGDSAAQYRLAQFYSGGAGTDQELQQAVKWYQRAADNGHAGAQFSLGVLYSTGKGVERDDGLAVDWYVNAAKQGYIDAQYNLGYMYASGRGVDQDLTRARTWYQLAADQGHARAQINLGAMYASGDGVERDDAKAADWYRKAAKQGDADAQFSLGYLYEFGRGVDNDRGQAQRWYSASADQGHVEAAHRLEALRAKVAADSHRVRVEMANLRAGPGTTYEVIGKLKLGTAVIMVGDQGEWIEVSIPGNTPGQGWLHNNLVDAPSPKVVAKKTTSTQPVQKPSATEAAVKTPAATAVSPAAVASSQTESDRPAQTTGTESLVNKPPTTPETISPAEQAELTAQARAAQGELKETLDERDALLQRLSSITKQTAALSAQIETMEAQRATMLNQQQGGAAADKTLTEPEAASEPSDDSLPPVITPASSPAASAGSSWLREGFASMLDRLDVRLLEIETRLATLESNQSMLATQLRETRQAQLRLASSMEKKLVNNRIQTVEAQAAEVSAQLELKQLEQQLMLSEQRSRDLENQLANRAANRDEEQQRLISLEEERDELMNGLDAAEKRLSDLRDQLTSDNPPQVQSMPLQPSEPAR